MKLPGRTATPLRPRITPQAKAEHALMQQLLLKLGQEACKQNGLTITPTHELPTGGTLATVSGHDARQEFIDLQVTVTVRVNPNTSAAIKL